MRYFLIPFTMLLWYLTTYYGIYISVIAIAYVFSISWIWLIIFYPIIIGLIFAISNGVPSLIRILILKFYGLNWFSCILHSLAGIIGLIAISRLYIENMPAAVIGDESLFILVGMWKGAPIKTIFVTILLLGLIISILWSTIVAPIYIKLTKKQEAVRAILAPNSIK